MEFFQEDSIEIFLDILLLMKRDLASVTYYTKVLTILYVEDDEAIREAMEETLSLFCPKIETAENGREGAEKFKQYYSEHQCYYDIVITDVRMPICDGIKMSREILQIHPDQEIIVLSAHNNSGILIEMINLGISHFLLKPVMEEQLLDTLYKVGHRIATAKEKERLTQEVHTLNWELRNKVIELDRLANEDPLTGISNRRRFFKYGDRLMTLSQEESVSLFLFVIDIDRFKMINDTYGHNIGDEVIRILVHTVRKHIDKEACFARLGGDEFIIMIRHTSREEALQQIESIRKEIDIERSISGITLHFTISAGMASLQQSDRTVDDLICRADENLYKAKKTTRNTIRG